MPASFGFPPDDPSGDWVVNLPQESGIGQVLVYGVPVAPPPAPFLRWKCDESALPLLEVNGFDHQLSAMTSGAYAFGRPTMRSDSTGSAVMQTGATDAFGNWTPAVTTVGTDFAIACLLGPDNPTSGAPYQQIAIAGICAFRTWVDSFIGQPPFFYMYEAGGTTTADTHVVDGTYTSGATAGTETFWAMRVGAGGTWTRWIGDDMASGTHSAATFPTAWHVQAESDDDHAFKFQEIHVWPHFVSDADIAAVRVSLLGL